MPAGAILIGDFAGHVCSIRPILRRQIVNMSAESVADAAAMARHTGLTVANILFALIVEETDNAGKP
jgi:hypothetical protein